VIDGVLQLDLPQASPDQTWSGPAPSFVVGPENALLVAPLERLLTGDDLAEAARLFNPLTLVGPSGSGKSQLAQAIVRHWRDVLGRGPLGGGQLGRGLLQQSVVEYFTAADFGREAQAAAAEERLADWQAHIRGLRVLVIEDLHRLRTRSTIHQELRHAIDAISAGGGVLVITAQREPATLPGLDAGLRDRLAAGLTLRLQGPGLAARLAILRTAASGRGMLIDDAELGRLAHREANSPAELVGRLKPYGQRSVTAHSPSKDAEQNCETGAAALKHIIAVTARYLGVTQAALTGPSRRSALVEARNIVVHLARRLTDLSYAEIGRQLGGRDHTTIMHAERRVTEQSARNPAIQQAVDELDRLVR
jgi:chromosomal replication initiator protein